MTSEDKEWFHHAVQSELGYMEKFLQAIRYKKSRMGPERRIAMYANSMHSMFESGRVMGLPSDRIIHWVTTPAEHCPSCLYLESVSPFTRYTIPTTPKAGSTKCLTNCKCKLVLEHVDISKVLQVSRKRPRTKTILNNLAKIKKGTFK